MPISKKPRQEIMDSVALLVLDAQDRFIETLYNKESFLLRTAFAIEAARNLGILTLFTEQAPERLGPTNRSLLKLADKPKIFPKKTFSALGAPGLEAFLREKEIYHVLVCGLETPICVYQTGLQAEEEDIDITFLIDALGCRRLEDEAPVLSALAKLGCHLLPSESVFYSLLGDVAHHRFRAFNNVVKDYGNKKFEEEEFFPKTPPPKRMEPKPTGPPDSENKQHSPKPKAQRRTRANRQKQEPPKSKGKPDSKSPPEKASGEGSSKGEGRPPPARRQPKANRANTSSKADRSPPKARQSRTNRRARAKPNVPPKDS